MNMIPKEEINAKEALKLMPPLIKGYLRLGAYVGDGAVVDKQFSTTDVLIIMPVEAIDLRYFSHFGAPDGGLAATCFKAGPFGPLGRRDPVGRGAGKGRR